MANASVNIAILAGPEDRGATLGLSATHVGPDVAPPIARHHGSFCLRQL